MSDEELYAKVAELVNGRGVDHLIGVGQGLLAAAERFAMECHFVQNVDELLSSGLLDTLHDELVLIKGARQFNFERLSEHLALKVHETTLEINLEALVDNLNYYRGFMKPEVKMVCMVKASAYGSGAIEVAKTLQDHRVDYLAVAVADEGVDLRKAGITANIIVMNPEMSTFETLFEYDLEPEVYSFKLLDAMVRAAEHAGVTNFPIHIKLDTGMHRLGFNPEVDMPALIDRIKGQSAVIPRSVFLISLGATKSVLTISRRCSSNVLIVQVVNFKLHFPIRYCDIFVTVPVSNASRNVILIWCGLVLAFMVLIQWVTGFCIMWQR